MLGAETENRGGRATDGPPGDGSGARRLRVLRLDDASAAAVVLAGAFADEPAKLALFPEEGTRRRLTEAVARARVRALAPYAAVHGVEIEGAIAGVAVWHPPNVRPGAGAVLPLLPALLMDGARVASLVGHVVRSLWRDRQAVRRLAAARLDAARTAQSGQSWYLALLGTDPGFRRRGVASQLLEHTLSRCDTDGLPTWLETTSAANVAFYGRLGYAQVAEIRGGEVIPDLWVMRREPRPTGARSA